MTISPVPPTLPDPLRGDGRVGDAHWGGAAAGLGLPPVSTDPRGAEVGFGSMKEAESRGRLW